MNMQQNRRPNYSKKRNEISWRVYLIAVYDFTTKGRNIQESEFELF